MPKLTAARYEKFDPSVPVSLCHRTSGAKLSGEATGRNHGSNRFDVTVPGSGNYQFSTRTGFGLGLAVSWRLDPADVARLRRDPGYRVPDVEDQKPRRAVAGSRGGVPVHPKQLRLL